MLLATLLLTLPTLAQGPRMTIRGTQTILAIDTAEITVVTRAGVAETEMLLTFRNSTDRPVEGEFSLPLPPGATISNYALEVNGSLREAVAVEKERALFAYETIKAQLIDPGIVERQAGNVYRTRVFPVPPRGTKQLRIGYVEVLPETARGHRYQCPLAFDPAPANITLTLDIESNATPTWQGDGDITFSRSKGNDVQTATLENTAISGTLEITTPAPDTATLLHTPGDAPHFLWCGRFPDLPETPRPAPKKILLFHDASESSLDTDPTAALDLLDAWFATLGPCKVELRHLRDRATPGGTHRVANGKWDTLRTAITTADPEGSTSFLDLTDAGSAADLVIYLGDGQPTATPRIGSVEKPLVILHTGRAPPATALTDTATRTGGAIISVSPAQREAALRQLATEPFRILSINGRTDIFHLIEGDVLQPGRAVRLIGQWPDGEMPALEITFASGTHTAKSTLPSWHGRESDLVRRLHAQRRLAALEAAPVPDRAAILDHCRTHNLASNTTSLIVLERFEDHIRYRIPPPEPDLLARYHAQIEAEPDPAQLLIASWQSHAAHHHRAHPGEEILLRPRIRQVVIWKDAVTTVFQQNEIPAAPFAAIHAWHRRALSLVERRNTLETAEAHAKWRAEIDAALQQARTLADTPADPPPAGTPIAVSVQGHVRTPGVVRADHGLTLLQAIERAGGPYLHNSLEFVALYRNADKTLYNPKSRQFKDVPLLPADMIVLENDPYGDIDPFSATPDPADQPAVIRQSDPWVTPDPFAGAGGGNRPQPNIPAIPIPEPADLVEAPDLAEFTRHIEVGQDPHTAWRKLKNGKRFPAETHIAAARILAAHRHHALATTLISTLVERANGIPPARLAEAFHLLDLNLKETAATRLAEPARDPSPLLTFARAQLTGDSTALARAIHPEGNTPFNLIAINQLQTRQPLLDADLRIVIQSADTARTPDILITDPLGHSINSYRKASQTGAILTFAPGLAEFTIHRAIPGKYTIQARSPVDTTLQITLHTDWARPAHQAARQTHNLPVTGAPATLTTHHWQFRPTK